jgi:nucleoside-diphosphate-sugar epimerase
MKTLVIGASGATGRLVVTRLLDKNIAVKVIIRESAILPKRISEDQKIGIIKGDIDAFPVERIKELMADCDSIVCCLGHTINFKGMFGKPRRLVYNAVKKVTEVLANSDDTKKFILMSTTAYTNKNQGEKNTFGESIVFNLLEILLPPHKDNVLSGDHLIYSIKKAPKIEWAAVRPDSLIDEDIISEYQICDAKTRSPIFNAGKTSRINVAHFIVDLLTEDSLWRTWKYKTPVIYNKEL